MANPGWYNDNQFRDYPFITRVEPLALTTGFDSESSGQIMLPLPSSTILDFGAIMDLDAEFDESAGHYIYLHSVSRFSDVFTFKLRTTAPAAANHELVFHRNLTDPEFSISRDSASTIEPEELPSLVCALQPCWSGFLVTGNLQDLADVIADGETLISIPALWRIEPARVQSLAQGYLRSVSLANAPRTHVTAQAGCSLDSSDSAERPVIVMTTCLSGPLNWREGFNCSIRQDVNDNAIIIGAGVGIGAGAPCEEIPLYEGEESPDGGPFLSGGPSCNEIIKSINGVSGTDVNIVAGPGFRIQPDTINPHKLVIERITLDDGPLSSVSVGDDDEPVITACNDVTADDAFTVTLLGGLLANSAINTVESVTCLYDAGLSLHGTKVWTSEKIVTSYWSDGVFCGFRWRAKVTCTESGLLVEVIGYPLADDTPCRTCAALIASPIVPPIATTLALTCSQVSADCQCFETNIATSILVEQV